MRDNSNEGELTSSAPRAEMRAVSRRGGSVTKGIVKVNLRPKKDQKLVSVGRLLSNVCVYRRRRWNERLLCGVWCWSVVVGHGVVLSPLSVLAQQRSAKFQRDYGVLR